MTGWAQEVHPVVVSATEAKPVGPRPVTLPNGGEYRSTGYATLPTMQISTNVLHVKVSSLLETLGNTLQII